jgi:hypothetical protein
MASLLAFVSSQDVDFSMPIYEMLHRLIRFGMNTLEVTLVSETVGWDGPRLVPDPDIEAPRIRDLFHNYLRVPAPIVIWSASHTGKLSDGRVIRGENPNGMPMARLVLIDKKGIVRNIDNGSELRVKHMLDELSRE